MRVLGEPLGRKRRSDGGDAERGAAAEPRHDYRGRAKGTPPSAWLVALATAMQESTLRNINYGDRDSLGLFQQRPSQGWGRRRR